MQEKENAALVLRLQAGDETAFDEIYAAYAAPAVRTAALISKDAHLAEDIAQEAFVLCMLKIHQLKNPLRFRSWFYRILVRCAWQMTARRQETLDEEILSRQMVLDEYPSHLHAAYEALYHALDALSLRQRTVVVLYYFSQLTIREIAAATSAPEPTVKTRLYAARRRLRRILEQSNRKGE